MTTPTNPQHHHGHDDDDDEDDNHDQLRAKQLHREYEAQTLASQKIHADWDKAQSTGDPLRSPSARKLANHWASRLADFINATAEDARRSRGPKPRWFKKALASLDADTLAQVTINSTLSALISERRVKISNRKLPKPLTSSRLSGDIGLAISKAARLTAFRKHNPAFFAAIERGQNEDGATPRHKEAVLNITLNTKARDPERATPEFIEATEPWTKRDRHSIGKWLFEAAVECAGGRITLVRHFKNLKSGRDTSGYYHVELHPTVYDWLGRDIKEQADRATFERAMVCPPVPWEGPKGGGYLLAHITSPNLVRGTTPGPVRRKIREKGIPQSPILSAINHLQTVPFAINEAVFSVASEAITSKLDLAQLPESFKQHVPPAPPKGDPILASPEFDEWKRKAAVIKRTNERNKARVLWSMSVMKEAQEAVLGLASSPAEELRGGPLWFAHHLDFRGRVYAAGSALNPQGSDLARYMLKFASGRAIGDGDGPRWLAAQVAKAFGHDKGTWEERIEWTNSRTDMLKRIADDPLGNRREWEAEASGGDSIWPALAAAREWTDYVARGKSPDFITTLPVFIDGTCNGLQHFAALARDSDLARMVNLVPGNAPRDIYQAIADTAFETIQGISRDYGAEDRQEALLWLRVLGDRMRRDLTKLIVMVKPYGGSHLNVYDVVQDYLDKEDPHRLHWGGDVPTAEEEKQLVRWLGGKLNEALGERTKAATNVMAWLKAAMELLCERAGDGPPAIERLAWRTPSGWPWHSVKYGKLSRRTSIVFKGEKRETYFPETNTREILTKKCLSGVSPNFVHSLDAAALMIAVEKAKAHGIDALITVHDCVAGLAPDMTTIARCVREGFIECHESDPLGTFREAVLAVLPEDAHERLPELGPLRSGDLDVRQVLASPYFFA